MTFLRPELGDALLLRYSDAAAMLRVSSRTVRRMAYAGELAVVAVGRSRRIRRRSLEEFVRGHVVRPTSHAREVCDALDRRRSRRLKRAGK
jgi:excisionase family DNA binding protein